MSALSWLTLEVSLHWMAIISYSVSAAFFAHGLFFERGRSTRWAQVASLVGLVPHGTALIVRWIEQGHGPYMSRFEVLSSDGWLALVLFLLAARRWPRVLQAGTVVLPTIFLVMAGALMADPGLHELPPSLRSIWLVLHVSFAKLAAGAMIISFGLSVLYLVQYRNAGHRWVRRLPDSEVVDESSYRFAGFGFVFWSVNIIAGSIWADASWGRYWAWDPIETWSLVTWLLYGIFAHLRVFWKLRGRSSAVALILCFLMSVFTIFILPFVAASLHAEYMVP